MSRLPFDPSRMGGVPAPGAGAARPAGLFGGAAPSAGGGSGAGMSASVPTGTSGVPRVAENVTDAPGTARAERAPLSVAQLAAIVEGIIRDNLPGSIRVIGEISNFSNRTHWYFSLKEGQVGGAVINCVMFAGRTRGVGFVPSEGQMVVLTGRVEYYKPQGKVSFAVEKIEPVGAGVLELAYQQLVQELRGLGYFAPERKRPLPTFPRRVAIITSRSGAALQDVINTMKRRCPAVELVLIDALMQGRQAAPDVARAIQWTGANATRLGIDVILLTRGGGSIEDLWAFNERIVADSVFNCPIPVACAIGHETDTTIAELVADERCSTPTQAAMRLTPDREELSEQLEMVRGRLQSALRRAMRQESDALTSGRRHLLPVLRARLDADCRRLEALSTRLERARPTAVLHRRAIELPMLGDRLTNAMRARIAGLDAAGLQQSLREAMTRSLGARRDTLVAMHRQLGLVGPLSVLARGYSVTTDTLGRIVRRVSDVDPGQVISTRVEDGVIDSVVGSDGPPRSVPVQGTVGDPVSEPMERPAEQPAQARPKVTRRVRARENDFTPGPNDLDGQLGLF